MNGARKQLDMYVGCVNAYKSGAHPSRGVPLHLSCLIVVSGADGMVRACDNSASAHGKKPTAEIRLSVPAFLPLCQLPHNYGRMGAKTFAPAFFKRFAARCECVGGAREWKTLTPHVITRGVDRIIGWWCASCKFNACRAVLIYIVQPDSSKLD